MQKLQAAHGIATTMTDERAVRLVLQAWGEAHLALGDHGIAREKLTDALRHAEGAAHPQDAHHVSLLLARLEITASDPAAALAAARAALAHAGTSPHLVGGAWATFADIAVATDQLDTAAAALLIAWDRLDTAGHAHAERTVTRLRAIWKTDATIKAIVTRDRARADQLLGDLVGREVHVLADLPPDRFAVPLQDPPA